MDKLLVLGIVEDDLKFILEQFPKIVSLSNEEIDEKISILKYVGCDDIQIRNIIMNNPRYLNKFSDDVLKLINYLRKLGLTDLNLLFEINPYFLDYEIFEIKNYIDKQINIGKSMIDIINEIESNPYVMDYE